MDKQEFLDLCNKWHDSCKFCKRHKESPEAKESYNKLKEECKINHKDTLQYIREALMETPNYMVKLLDDFYKEEFNIELYYTKNDYLTIDKYCNLWLSITGPEFDGKYIKDYYKDWRAWHEYLKENYISWNLGKENDPNVTFQEFKQGKRNNKR